MCRARFAAWKRRSPFFHTRFSKCGSRRSASHDGWHTHAGVRPHLNAKAHLLTQERGACALDTSSVKTACCRRKDGCGKSGFENCAALT